MSPAWMVGAASPWTASPSGDGQHPSPDGPGLGPSPSARPSPPTPRRVSPHLRARAFKLARLPGTRAVSFGEDGGRFHSAWCCPCRAPPRNAPSSFSSTSRGASARGPPPSRPRAPGKGCRVPQTLLRDGFPATVASTRPHIAPREGRWLRAGVLLGTEFSEPRVCLWRTCTSGGRSVAETGVRRSPWPPSPRLRPGTCPEALAGKCCVTWGELLNLSVSL